MNKFLSLLALLLFPIFVVGQTSFDALLQELDQTVSDYHQFLEQKETKIGKLKKHLNQSNTDAQSYHLYGNLYSEYKAYQSDSALVYARKEVAIANKINDFEKTNEAKLNYASIMGTLGMYKEAIDILDGVKIETSPNLKGAYLWTHRIIYGALSDYTTSIQEKNKYLVLTKKYRDSSLLYYPKNAPQITIVKAEKSIDLGNYDQTLKLLLPYFPSIATNNPDRAVIAYIISEVYHLKKNSSAEEKWLAISAISDLQLVKKENISLRKLAIIRYNQGDIDRAYTYTKRSLEDALFCSARLRTYEISKMLPIINDAYEHKNETNRWQLTVFLISVSVLSLFLLGVLILLFKQMKKLGKAQKSIHLANAQLSILNKELNEFNKKLNQSNISLAETNLVKEIYIGRYMDQCSDYIGKLEEYSSKLKVMATAGKMNDLVHTVKSNAFIEGELKEFYTNFDQTFLKLFPNFIEEFTALLGEKEATQPKEGELLNTELRIFALIRLGIKDSTKIAGFLRYSVSTIYNYRSQLKNKSLGPRDQFENSVMAIGTANKE
ncbi:DUF6377 domain-containing protein [Flavobacterium restrictum]|uniref:DUF6377 domain-containing protein n=1 Tax=Flavobacterium restrictum TaxID=2594428 RepID=A0A553EBQ9_9FLAO|nr:DUF6377 domain-containing protein [Flavobacterium restrictum]TRX42402.1 hypothetical protein FNW21_03845 [Flavobacterium restrictum]